MKLFDLVRLGARVATAKRHDRWSRAQVGAHQAARLARLVAFARWRSPYYRDVLPGRGRLADLPALDKATLGARWDDIVTVRDLKQSDARAFLDAGPGARDLWRGRYHVMSTSGTTDVSSVFCYSDTEWLDVMTSAARLTAWRGAGPSRRTSLALVMLPGLPGVPPPMGARISATMASLVPRLQFIDASQPTDRIAAELHRAQPDILSAYAGTLAILAEEQLAGRLSIAPKIVQSTSEVLTAVMRARIEAAFGVAPHDTYAMTEAGMVAATCATHRGLHVQEDSVILENVDERGAPVAPGTFGARVLLTVLWSRTLPLIRYEITDRVCFATEPCPCGLPYSTIREIDGRASDVLVLTSATGADVRITPDQIERILAPCSLVTWQLRKAADGLRIDVVPQSPSFDSRACEDALQRALADAGVSSPRATVHVTDRIAPTPAGKVPRFILRA